MSDEKDREAEEPQPIEDDDGDEDRTRDEAESEEEEEVEVLRLGRNPSPLPGGLDLADLSRLENQGAEEAAEASRDTEDFLSDARREIERAQEMMAANRSALLDLQRASGGEFMNSRVVPLEPPIETMRHVEQIGQERWAREARIEEIQVRQANALEALRGGVDALNKRVAGAEKPAKWRFIATMVVTTAILIASIWGILASQ